MATKLGRLATWREGLEFFDRLIYKRCDVYQYVPFWLLFLKRVSKLPLKENLVSIYLAKVVWYFMFSYFKSK